ncbi:hypothetical protein [Viridibacterium curvum]|uniref:Uncharacterized protein n=1 Tax=Viridibacterium curvum TaxID=1101404 RepID=A0ABP9QIE9_9RHOO
MPSRLIKARTLLSLVAALAGLATTAHADQNISLRTLQSLPEVQATLDPAIRMLWLDEAPPALVESTPVANYNATGISVIPFNVDESHCHEAFVRVLKNMLETARTAGYDVIYDIRPALKDGPANSTAAVFCSTSPTTARVFFTARMGMTQNARTRADSIDREAERLAINANRPAAKGALYIPFAPIIESPEIRDLLGNDVSLVLGSQNPPAYALRYGPITYSESADSNGKTPTETCQAAAIATLRSMIKDARANRYNGLIRVRSYLNNQIAPSPTDIECEAGNRSAKVVLRTILIQKK